MINWRLKHSSHLKKHPDQQRAIMDVKRDMERDVPMDRLVCGDVGFGKQR